MQGVPGFAQKQANARKAKGNWAKSQKLPGAKTFKSFDEKTLGS